MCLPILRRYKNKEMMCVLATKDIIKTSNKSLLITEKLAIEKGRG